MKAWVTRSKSTDTSKGHLCLFIGHIPFRTSDKKFSYWRASWNSDIVIPLKEADLPYGMKITWNDDPIEVNLELTKIVC